MKIKIKVKLLNPICKLKANDEGDWIDLRCADSRALRRPRVMPYGTKRISPKEGEGKNMDVARMETVMLPLGVAIRLPKGFEAVIAPRSSSYKNFGFVAAGSIGVIDNSYCGDGDEWKFPVVPLWNAKVNAGDRVCQFRVRLSQKATLWQKLKWLLSSGVKIVYVDSLGDQEDRGGFGTTGKE